MYVTHSTLISRCYPASKCPAKLNGREQRDPLAKPAAGRAYVTNVVRSAYGAAKSKSMHPALYTRSCTESCIEPVRKVRHSSSHPTCVREFYARDGPRVTTRQCISTFLYPSFPRQHSNSECGRFYLRCSIHVRQSQEAKSVTDDTRTRRILWAMKDSRRIRKASRSGKSNAVIHI